MRRLSRLRSGFGVRVVTDVGRLVGGDEQLHGPDGRARDDRGLYLLDEPDAALSFTGTLELVALLTDLVGGGARAVIATHSPVLAALPAARVFEVGPWGLREAVCDELELTAGSRQFLNDPQSFLRRLR